MRKERNRQTRHNTTVMQIGFFERKLFNQAFQLAYFRLSYDSYTSILSSVAQLISHSVGFNANVNLQIKEIMLLSIC